VHHVTVSGIEPSSDIDLVHAVHGSSPRALFLAHLVSQVTTSDVGGHFSLSNGHHVPTRSPDDPHRYDP
jgi:hypothetical protein